MGCEADKHPTRNSISQGLITVSTKKQTDSTQTNTYNPASMNAYNRMTNQVSGFTKNWLEQPDLTKTQGFNLGYQSLLDNANALSGRNIQNMTFNALATGMNPNSAAFNAQLQRATRAGSALQSNAFLNAYQNAQGQQNFAAQMANGYRPLQTGGTSHSTEMTSGTGTWLPQLAGAAIGGATAFATGGMSKMMPSFGGGSAPSQSGAGLGWGGSTFDGTNPTWR